MYDTVLLGDDCIRILVTGGAGYVGSVLVPYLLEKHTVRVVDNLTYGYYGILPHLGNPDFEFIHEDVRNKEGITQALRDVNFVVHLAALVGYPACKARPHLAETINYQATKQLVSLCQVPLLFASSGSNYGHVKETCTEETPLHPLTEYGKTKVRAEQKIQTASDYIIYRFSTGFGLSLRPRLDLLVNDFLMQAMKNKELIVFEKDYCRSFIHVKDMARSILFAIEHFDAMNKEIYNVGSETLCLTKKEVALKIQNFVDYYLKFAEFGTDPDQRNYRVSFEKIRSAGFTTQYDLEYGIQEMMKGFCFLEQKEHYYNNRVFQ